MRDRLLELLPLLLVSAVLLAFYLLRNEGPGLPFQPLSAPLPFVNATPTSEPVVVTARRTPACTPDQPVFVGNIASLKSALGAQMGNPLECEHPIDASGNTQQKTTSGLAYFRKASNLACFTTGWDHWALVRDHDVAYWAGDAIEPPAGAFGISR